MQSIPGAIQSRHCDVPPFVRRLFSQNLTPPRPVFRLKQHHNLRRRVMRTIGATATAWVLACSALAHPELGNYVQHRVIVKPHGGNIDVSLEITFTGARSLKERSAMDADGDGNLTPRERAEAARKVAGDAASKLRVSIDGAPLDLITLYEPSIDLLDGAGVIAHPHVLKLYLFARHPKPLKADSEILVETALWLDEPAIILVETDNSAAPNAIKPMQVGGLFEAAADPESVRKVPLPLKLADRTNPRNGEARGTRKDRAEARRKGR